MKRIGITVNIQGNIFSNGVNQNAIFLAKVLKKCGYIVDLICADEKTISEVNKFKVDGNVFSLNKSYSIRYNLIIQLGHSIEKKMSSNWIKQNPNIKFVAYECGNHYLINTEKMIFHKSVETNYFRDLIHKNKIETEMETSSSRQEFSQIRSNDINVWRRIFS